MSRDRRLLIPLILLVLSFIALLIQAYIVNDYIRSSVLDSNWEMFSEKYGVEAPHNGPELYCFDYCAPKLPFWFGWSGIGLFVTALIFLTYIWWKPKT